MNRPRLFVAALVALTLLPAAAFASGFTAARILAAELPFDPTALADKSMATWFLTLAALAIGSWTWVFKWLVGQLESQRTTNAELVRELLNKERTENTELKDLLKEAIGALREAKTAQREANREM